MRRMVGTLVGLGLVVASVAGGPSAAAPMPETSEIEGTQDAAASGSALDALRDTAVPGEHHDHLARLAGTWEASGSYWLPSGERVDSQASIEAVLILGGLFLETRIVTEIEGETYEGRGLDGYDDVTGQYRGAYVDSLRTAVLDLSGTCRDAGRVRTMVAAFIDPIWGKPMQNRVVVTLVDDDTYRIESTLIHDDGREFPQAEYTARRGR